MAHEIIFESSEAWSVGFRRYGNEQVCKFFILQPHSRGVYIYVLSLFQFVPKYKKEEYVNTTSNHMKASIN
jgi:hypothetical protein